MGDVVRVRRDHELVAILRHGDFGNDKGVVIRRHAPAWAGIEEGDVFGGLLGFAGGDAEMAGDVGEASFAKRLKVIAHDAVLERLLTVHALQLEQQALAEVACADTRRVETLDDLQDGLDLVGGDAGCEGDSSLAPDWR